MSSLLQLVVCIYSVSVSVVICVSNDGHQTQVTEKPPIRNITKRYDIDVQTCMESFDIQKDKIIRTEDSRAMGAKYINEIDVGSREECLRMCCETNTCDVFVFEEKNPGSCYMFHCGSPDDFKCRFTKHHNYTSAVLAVSRQVNELEDQIRLTKHEQELNQLRKPDVAPSDRNTAPPPVVITSTVVTAAPVKEAPPAPQPVNNTAVQVPRRTCSHYQFECRSSGECIAIYNACDGIPQCVDGSDEAPELYCPSPVVTTQSPVMGGPPTAPPPVESIPFETPVQQQPLVPAPQRPPPQAAPQYRPPVSAWNQQQQQQPPPQYPGVGVDVAQPAVRSGKPYGREGEGPIPGPNYNMANSLQWSGYPQQPPPRQPLQAQPPPVVQQHPQQTNYRGQFPNHEYEDQNSHIFTHKGNGLVADSDSPAGQYNEQYGKYGNQGPVNGYYNNAPYRPPPQANWQLPPPPPQQQQQPSQAMAHELHGLEDLSRQQKLPAPDNSYSGPPIPPDYYYEDSQEARYHPPPAHEQELVHHAGIPHGERESIADGATPIQVKHPPPHQHHHKSAPIAPVSGEKQEEHKGSIEVHVKEPEQTTTAKPTAQKTTHHAAHHKKHPLPEITMEETSVIVEPVDGEVGRPNGAILSLSLGLCITVFMVILVVCRLRMVRRRLRRGKSPYAHDADYLVNGMYL